MDREIIELTKKLITYKTITGEHNEVKSAFYFIKDYLKNRFILEEEKNHYFSLMISNASLKNKFFDIIFHGHIDVVAPNEDHQFNPKEIDNRIYGRGALDMKGGLATLIFLLKNLEKEGLANKKLLLLITSDEEIGGMNGTYYLFKKYRFKSKFFITAEGEKDYLIKIKQKGVLMLKLSKTTRGEHSAYTWKSKNAILEIFKTYERIANLFPSKKDKNHWYTTINLGKIEGGTAVNSIPDFAEAKIDIRFCEPWKSPEEILKPIKKITSKNKTNVEVLYQTNLMKTDITNKNLHQLNKICQKKLGIRKNLYFNNHGTNDARFANYYGIPAVGFGPIGDNYHAKNEYVFIDSLYNYYEIIKKFVKEI